MNILAKTRIAALAAMGAMAVSGAAAAREIHISCSEIADVAADGKLTIRNNGSLAAFERRNYVIDTAKNTVAEKTSFGQSSVITTTFTPATNFRDERNIYSFSRQDTGNTKTVAIDIATGAYRVVEGTVDKDGTPYGVTSQTIGVCGFGGRALE